MNSKKILLTAAIAGLTLGGSLQASDGYGKAKESKVKCQGVNSCKGKGHSGQNKCKGKGWKYMTQKDCTAAKAALKAEEKAKSQKKKS